MRCSKDIGLGTLLIDTLLLLLTNRQSSGSYLGVPAPADGDNNSLEFTALREPSKSLVGIQWRADNLLQSVPDIWSTFVQGKID